MDPKAPVDIEIVEDRTAGSRPDEGFLRVRRLVVRNVYADGSRSGTYNCDVLSRRRPDAVAVLPYEQGADGTVRVALRTGTRPVVYLRKHKDLLHPDEGDLLLLLEMPAGLLEEEDAGEAGIANRAALECAEETGIRVDTASIEPLDGPLFPSPGVSDEKVFFRAVRSALDAVGERTTDGSVMEEAGELVVLELDEAIARCRAGTLPDMKTEIALVRLRDRLRGEG
ncbi:MAG: NUDIX hydrolase [Planctomycetota bacterium]|nr:NUDIX hydrolase [Planctomycetota bacterium]